MAGIRSLSDLAGRSERSNVELLATVAEPETYQILPPSVSYAGPVPPETQAWADGFLSHVEGKSPSIEVYRIRNCFITPNAALMTASGAVVKESLYPYVRATDVEDVFRPFITHDRSGPPDDVSMTIQNTTIVDEPIFFGREHGEAGYFHWIHSILPRVRVYSQVDLPPHPLLVAMSSRFQNESLDLVGWPSGLLLPSDGNTVICREVIFCTPMVSPDLDKSGGFFERVLFANKMLRGLSRRASTGPPARKLYVSRNDAAIRRLENEVEIGNRLVQFGFEVVSLSSLSFADQIQLFGSAAVVISVHGAGLSNIAFMPEGGKIVEILAPDRLWPTYRGVAARSNLLYFPYVGRAAGEIRKGDSDISIDAAHFLEFLADAIEESA